MKKIDGRDYKNAYIDFKTTLHYRPILHYPLVYQEQYQNQTSCQEVKFQDVAQAWAGHYYCRVLWRVSEFY